MLSITKRQIRRSLDALGYRIVRAPMRPDATFYATLNRLADGRTIPPKMLDPGYPGTEDAPLYLNRYGIDALLNRRFYNIGAAWNRHSCWTNVDHPSSWYAADQADNLDLPWDISTLAPIEVQTGTAEAVYSSHTVEHLLDEHVEHMLREAYRILKPSGFLRITCPNIELYFEAYRRRDDDLTMYRNLRPHFSHQQIFLNEFASQLTDIMKSGNPQGAAPASILDSEVDRLFANGPVPEAFDHFTSMIDYELHKITPGAHINWWTHEKVERFMRRAGFTKVRRSAHKQSACVAMRGAEFDTTHPAHSLYVEAER